MILVTGSTGKVGIELIDELTARGAEFRALARSAESEARLRARGVTTVRGDLTQPETLPAALEGVDHVFLLTPAHPLQSEWEGALVTAAAEAGVQHIVKLSVWGVDPEASVSLLRWHGQSEGRIKSSGIGYTFVRPNSFFQNLVPSYGASIASQGTFYTPSADARISHIDARDIAAVAATALTEPGHEGQVYELSGPEALSYADVADKLTALLGRTVSHVAVSDADARQGLLSAGLPDWYADGLIELYQFYRADRGSALTDTVRQVTGRPPRTIDGYLAENRAAFEARSA